MKKHDEGYVLAMVMVVIAVLAIVASTMLSVGLRNVQTQQLAVERMQAKYEAEGTIEKVIAGVDVIKLENVQEDQVKSDFETSILNYLGSFNEDNSLGNENKIKTSSKWVTEGAERICEFAMETEDEYIITSGDKTINETILVEVSLELKYKVEQDTSYKYVASVKAIDYTSYKITTTSE